MSGRCQPVPVSRGTRDALNLVSASTQQPCDVLIITAKWQVQFLSLATTIGGKQLLVLSGWGSVRSSSREMVSALSVWWH